MATLIGVRPEKTLIGLILGNFVRKKLTFIELVLDLAVRFSSEKWSHSYRSVMQPLRIDQRPESFPTEIENGL